MTRLVDLLRRASRALLLRIEMRMRHTLETWAPLQSLFSQTEVLDHRTASIEQRIDDLSEFARQINNQLAVIATALAQLQLAFDGDHTRLQLQLAPLEARLVRLDAELAAARREGKGPAAPMNMSDGGDAAALHGPVGQET